MLNIYSEGLMAPRDSRNIVIDNIINDLDQTIELLEGKSQIGATRVNKEAALAFKSRWPFMRVPGRSIMTERILELEGSNPEEYLQIAADAAEILVNDANLYLYSTGNPDEDYWKLFNHNDLTGNPEVLLMEPVDPQLDLGTWVWTQ